MANILDYLAWRGDLTLSERPFNEVDNVILSVLAYLRLDGLGLGPGQIVLLEEVIRRYRAQDTQSYSEWNNPEQLLDALRQSARFGGMGVSNYVNELDTEKQLQFAAMTFHLEDGSIYVAFRGTDATLTGWREDFNTTYLSETPGQALAVRYLEDIASRTRGVIRVGGHSKGGNLAVYAAAFAPEGVRYRIQVAFSNDGPGCNSKVSDTMEYRSILDRVTLIVPETSLVGILLNNKEDKIIVRSSASGARQHSPYTWLVKGACFERAEKQAPASIFLDSAMEQWSESLTDAQKEKIISSVFDALEEGGMTTLQDVKDDKAQALGSLLRSVRGSDDTTLRDAGIGLLRLLQPEFR